MSSLWKHCRQRRIQPIGVSTTAITTHPITGPTVATWPEDSKHYPPALTSR